MKRTALVLLLAFSSCCGVDQARLRADQANLALAKRCAEGWIEAQPIDAQDAALVKQALADWERRLAAEVVK